MFNCFIYFQLSTGLDTKSTTKKNYDILLMIRLASFQ